MVGCLSEKLSLGSARELSQVHPSPTMALHSEPWCLASQGRRSQPFSQDQCLSVPSPCKVLTNQDGFWLVAAALGVDLSQQSVTIAFHYLAEWEPLAVCLSTCLAWSSISICILSVNKPRAPLLGGKLLSRDTEAPATKDFPSLSQYHPQSYMSILQTDKKKKITWIFLGQGCSSQTGWPLSWFPSVQRGLAVVPSVGTVSGCKLRIWRSCAF